MPPCDLDKISMQAIAGIKLTSSVLEVKILITGPPGKSQRAKVLAAPNVNQCCIYERTQMEMKVSRCIQYQ